MEITRYIFNDLKAWKDSKRRKPLDIGFRLKVQDVWVNRLTITLYFILTQWTEMEY